MYLMQLAALLGQQLLVFISAYSGSDKLSCDIRDTVFCYIRLDKGKYLLLGFPWYPEFCTYVRRSPDG